MRRVVYRALPLALLLAVPLLADAANLIHVRWEGLNVAVGQKVSIAMPDGTVVTGKATAVESDALVVQVKKSTVRVPRANLHRFEMQTKGKVWRTVATPLGFCIGFGGGALAAFGLEGGIFGNKHDAAAGTAFFGITAAGTVAGYFIGNAADKHWTAVEILP